MTSKITDQIRGCLFGGAVGDALGYPIEFRREYEIFHRYGKRGISQYRLDYDTGEAIISDDTQMALFTANAVLVHQTNTAQMRLLEKVLPEDAASDMRYCQARACDDWLTTQRETFWGARTQRIRSGEKAFSWLLNVQELFDLRAPGNSCLAALEARRRKQDFQGSFVDHPVNQSKGCGGIMRIAPIALIPDPELPIEWIDREAAQASAVTHGHSLGYLTSAVLAHVIRRIVFPPEEKPMELKDIILEAKETVSELFRGDPHMDRLRDIIDLAVLLADPDDLGEGIRAPQGKNKDTNLHGVQSAQEAFDKDLENIHMLGEGWVAEETLGIALYCALRHQDDFSAGVIASVNHKGDSDSTGAVTGNILGALHGYDAIEEKWKNDLELSKVILEIADDLAHSSSITPDDLREESAWMEKYGL